MSDLEGGNAGFPTPPPPPPGDLSPPPGYAAYGTDQEAFSSFRRVGSIARWMGYLLIVIVPVQAIALILSASDRDKARDFIAGRITESEYTKDIGASALLETLSSAIFVAVVVLTMVWMWRMAKNSQALDRVATWKPGWAIGGWFVPPFVLYVIPFLMFRDLWKASDPDGGSDWRTNRVGPIVNVWWVLYGLAPAIFFSATLSTLQVGRSAKDVAKQIDDSFGLTLGSTLVQIASAIAYLLLVRQLTARHKRMIAES